MKAVVVGPPILREYLINYARPLIYSTSLPHHSLLAIDCAYSVMYSLADEVCCCFVVEGGEEGGGVSQEILL